MLLLAVIAAGSLLVQGASNVITLGVASLVCSDFQLKLASLSDLTKVSQLCGHEAPLLWVEFDQQAEYLVSIPAIIMCLALLLLTTH